MLFRGTSVGAFCMMKFDFDILGPPGKIQADLFHTETKRSTLQIFVGEARPTGATKIVRNLDKESPEFNDALGVGFFIHKRGSRQGCYQKHVFGIEWDIMISDDLPHS